MSFAGGHVGKEFERSSYDVMRSFLNRWRKGFKMRVFLIMTMMILSLLACGQGDSVPASWGDSVTCDAPVSALTDACAADHLPGQGWPIECEALPSTLTPAQAGCVGDPDTRWCCPVSSECRTPQKDALNICKGHAMWASACAALSDGRGFEAAGCSRVESVWCCP